MYVCYQYKLISYRARSNKHQVMQVWTDKTATRKIRQQLDEDLKRLIIVIKHKDSLKGLIEQSLKPNHFRNG